MVSFNLSHCSLIKNSKIKIVAIILIFAYIFPLIMFRGSIDSFQLLQGALSYEVSQYGFISNNYLISEIPAFYAYGAIILDIIGISPMALNFLPIQLLPLILLLYVFFHRISGNNIFAGLIVLIEMISGTTGTFRVYFWPHGLGYILFFTILLICILIFDKYYTDKRLNAMLLVVVFSLLFICYNYTAITLLFLVSACFYFSILRYTSYSSFQHTSLTNFYGAIIIAILGLFGISKFVYNSLIPLYNSIDVDYSTFDKLIASYITRNSINDPILDLLIVYPTSITILSTLKYLIYLIAILLFMGLTVYKCKYSIIDYCDIISLSIMSAIFIYMIPRMLIGDFFITSLYLPGLVCLASLYKYGKQLNQKLLSRLILIFIMVILIINPIIYGINYDNSTINIDDNNYIYAEEPAKWLLNNCNYMFVSSDELTKNSLIAYSSVSLLRNISSIKSYTELYTRYKRISKNELLSLIKRSNVDTPKKYYIINMDINYLSLGEWTSVIPWHYYIESVNSNLQICQTYNSGKIKIYI